jgi:hypothetical protein
MDQLRAKGFFASDMIKLNLTRGEAMQLLAALSFQDYRPARTCGCCGKTMAPGRGRTKEMLFTCYTCLVIGGRLAANEPPVEDIFDPEKRWELYDPVEGRTEWDEVHYDVYWTVPA